MPPSAAKARDARAVFCCHPKCNAPLPAAYENSVQRCFASHSLREHTIISMPLNMSLPESPVGHARMVLLEQTGFRMLHISKLPFSRKMSLSEESMPHYAQGTKVLRQSILTLKKFKCSESDQNPWNFLISEQYAWAMSIHKYPQRCLAYIFFHNPCKYQWICLN